MRPDPSHKSARTAAAEALARFDPRRERIDTEALLADTLEKQRATDLVSAVIRNLAAIDHTITAFSGCPVQRITGDLLAILRVAACELIYRPQTPDYSILSEAVQAAKQSRGPRQAAFVNAVGRRIQRHIVSRQGPLEPAAARCTLPQTPDSGCRFDTDILPDPDEEPAAYLSAAFSLPVWLVRDWLACLGPDHARRICEASNRNPGLYIRPNALRTTPDNLLQTMIMAGIDGQITPDGRLIRLHSPHAVADLPGYADGLFSVQDPAAARAVALLAPQGGWTILDPCAAPGTKTTQLAEAAGDKARIIASDINAGRLQRVRENAERLGLGSVETVAHADLPAAIDAAGPIDAVLLDVPCSNTGVLARRVEVRHRITAGAVGQLAAGQRRLLETYAAALKPGGRLCYSTCSIQTCENRAVIDAFLKQHDEFELVGEELLLPAAGPFDHDGAYATILLRR